MVKKEFVTASAAVYWRLMTTTTTTTMMTVKWTGTLVVWKDWSQTYLCVGLGLGLVAAVSVLGLGLKGCGHECKPSHKNVIKPA